MPLSETKNKNILRCLAATSAGKVEIEEYAGTSGKSRQKFDALAPSSKRILNCCEMRMSACVDCNWLLLNIKCQRLLLFVRNHKHWICSCCITSVECHLCKKKFVALKHQPWPILSTVQIMYLPQEIDPCIVVCFPSSQWRC